jgi:hypothetical protein
MSLSFTLSFDARRSNGTAVRTEKAFVPVCW